MTQAVSFESATCIAQSPRCISTEVGSETVLLHLDEGMYFGLDPVGMVIWDAMAKGARFDELADAVCMEFSVERETATRDLEVFLGQLDSNGLVLLE